MLPSQEPISKPDPKTLNAPTRAMGCGGVVFLLIGLAFLIGFVILPLSRVISSSHWARTPCTILSSAVESRADSDGTTYRIKVEYEYVLRDHRYVGTRYNFTGISSSAYAYRQRIIRGLPPGTRTVCFVNPSDPADAVLTREIGSDIWAGVIPLIFVAIGIGLIVGQRRARQRTQLAFAGQALTTIPGRAITSIARGPARERSVISSLPLDLKPAQSPRKLLLVMLLFAIIWNGIISVVVYNTVSGWVAGKRDFCLAIFMVPFVVAGIGIIGVVIYQFLAIFNPVPRLTLGRESIAPGETTEVRWSLDGRYDRIARLTIRLEGREEAMYRRGTSTVTDRSVFARVEVVDTTRAMDMASGRHALTIPPGTMHSFETTHNKIIWSLQLHGEISRWPDVKTEFPITVMPPAVIHTAPGPMAEPVLNENAEDFSVEFEPARTQFAPGDSVSGFTQWRFDAAPKSVEVRLFWYTSGKGTRDVGVIQSVSIPSPAMAGSYRFNLALPASPISFSGKLISLIWAVEAIAQIPDESKPRLTRKEFACTPTEQPTVLGVVPKWNGKWGAA